MERLADIEICERKERAQYRDLDPKFREARIAESLPELETDEFCCRRGRFVESLNSRLPCKSPISQSIFSIWLISLAVVAYFIAATALADHKYSSRAVEDCFFWKNNGTLVIPGTKVEIPVTTWVYTHADHIYSTSQTGVDTEQSPQDCYVSLGDPADVVLGWDVPRQRRNAARGLEISIPIFLLLSAGVSLIKTPCAGCACWRQRRTSRLTELSKALLVRSADSEV